MRWKSALMTSMEETPGLAPALSLESIHPGILLVLSHTLGGASQAVLALLQSWSSSLLVFHLVSAPDSLLLIHFPNSAS